MNYCKHCMIPTKEPPCPVCGEEPLWPALPEDPCFAAELEGPWSDMYADLLEQRQIPCLRKQVWGMDWTAILGNRLAKMSFYVPYERLSDAQELAQALFARNGTETEE